jgi:prepilin-type processing-associated H-X9-DG protein
LINDFLTPNPAGASTLNYSNLSWLSTPRSTVLFAEASKDYTKTDHYHFADYAGQTIPPDVFSEMVGVERHGGKANYLFADGHVETLSWKQVKETLRTPGNHFVDPTDAPSN